MGHFLVSGASPERQMTAAGRRTKAVRNRGAVARMLGLAATAAMVFAPVTRAADMELDVKNGSTDLTSAGSYVQNAAPSATTDLTFLNQAYSPSTFTVNGGVTTGTLDDLSPAALTITNTDGSASTLKLSTLGNAVSLFAADLLYVANGASLTIQDGTGTLGLAIGVAGGNVDIAGLATINSNITSTGAFGFTKIGTGTLTLAGANSYTGATILSAGTVVAAETSGTPFGAGNLTLNAATLNLTPTTTGSDVSLTAASGTAGLFTYGAGGTLVLNANGNTSLTFTVGSGAGTAFARGTAGTLIIQPTSIDTLGTTENFVVSGNAPTVASGIVSPSIIGQASRTDSSGTFLTYGAGGATGFSQFTGYTTQGANFTPAAATEIDDVTASVTVTPGTSNNPYAIRIGASNTLTVGGANPLTLGSGGVILNGNGATITGGTLGLGAFEGLIYTASGTNLISSVISGSAGFTKFGPGTLILGATANTTVANTFTGSINVNGGTLAAVITQLNNATANSPIGGTGGRVITLNGGTFELLAGSALYNPQASTSSIVIGAGGGTLQIDAGGITLDDASQFVSGAGGTLTKTGTAQLTLGNSASAFTVTGPITIAAGSLRLLNNGTNALGNSPLVTIASGAELDLNGLTANRPLSLSGTGLAASAHGALTTSSGGNGTYSGPVTLATATTIGGTGAGAINISGAISGTGPLTKIDANTLSLSSSTGSTFSGGVTVNAGTLNLSNTSGSAVGAGNITLNSTGGTNLTSGAVASIVGTVTSATSGTNTVIAPGGIYAGASLTTIGSLKVGGLNLTSNATTLVFDLSTPTGSNDLLTITGLDAFTITGTATNKVPIILGQAPAAPGTYHLIAFNQDQAGTVSASSFSFGSTGNGRLSYSLQVDPGTGTQQFLDLVVGGSGTPITSNFIGTSTPTSWTVPSNWSTNPLVPGVAGDVVTFNNGSNSPGTIVVTLDGQERVGSLSFNNSGATSFNIAPGTNTTTSPALFFDNTPNAAAATLINSSNNNTLSAPVTLISATNVTVTGTSGALPNVLTISGNLNGAALALTSSSTGVLALSGTNTGFAGGISVAGGTLRAGSVTAFGTATTTVVSGGTVDLNGQALTTTPITLNGTGVGGLGALINSSTTAASDSATVALASAASIGGTGNITLSAVVSGSGPLTKTGTSNLTLSNGNNTLSGAVTINGGTLTLTSVATTAANGVILAPSITVNPAGTLILNASAGDTLGFTVNRNALIINGGSVLNNGAARRQTISNTINMIGGVLGGTSVGDTPTATAGGGAYSFNVATAVQATSDANGNPAVISALAVSLQSATAFNVTRGAAGPASDLLVSSAIIPYSTAGTNGLTKAGNGIMTLTGASTYVGATTVNFGTLALANNTGNVLGATNITVGSGAAITATAGNATLLVRGNNTIGTAGITAPATTSGSLSISGGDGTATGQGTLSLIDSSINTLNFTTRSTAGTALTFGSPTQAGLLSLELGTTGGASGVSDRVNLNNNNLVVNAGNNGVGAIINVVPTGAVVAGTYMLLSYGSETNASSTGGFAFSNGLQTLTVNGATLTLRNTSTAEFLDVSAAGTAGPVPPTAYFQGSVDNNWNTIDPTTSVTNFTTDSAGMTNTFQLPGAATDVHFYATNADTTKLATNLNQNFTIKSLTLDGGSQSVPVSIASGGDGTNLLTIAPATGTPGITLNAGAGSLTITTPVALGAAQTWTNNSSNVFTVSGPSLAGSTFALTITGTGNTVISAPITGSAALAKSGAGSLTLSGTNSNTAGTTILGGSVIVGSDNALGTGPVTFGAVNTTGIASLNLNTANQTAGLISSLSNSSTPNTITVGAGKTLTATNGVTIGYDASSFTPLATETSKLAISGAGSVNITGGTVTVGVSQSGFNAANASAGTLDTSSLTGSFTASVTAFNVGSGNDDLGIVTLGSGTNTIVTPLLQVGHSNANNSAGTSSMTLGTGTNVLKADTINIAFSKATANLRFASQAANSSGTVTITNAAGNGGANINVGSQAGSNTGTALTGTLDLRGHNATVTAATVAIGNNNNSGGGGNASGVLSFDTGTFNATTLNLGLKSSSGTASNTGNQLNIGGGTFSVSGATAISTHTGTAGGNVTSLLAVSAGSFSTGTLSGANKNTGAGTGVATSNINVSGTGSLVVTGNSFVLATQSIAGTAVSTLTITGSGSVTSNADITDGGGAATTTITLTSGLLDLKGNKIGGSAAANFIDNLNFEGGTLQNVSQINNGAGLTKTTSGTLTLAGVDSFSGAVNVNAGTLLVNGTLTSSAAPVNVAGSTTLGGRGSIAGLTTVAASGTLAPSTGSALPLSAPLTLTGGVNFTDNLSKYTVALAASASTSTPSYDEIIVGSPSALNGATLVVNDALYAAAGINKGDQFWIIDGASPSATVNGTFANGATVIGTSGSLYTIAYNVGGDPLGTGNDVVLTAVPEPMAMSLMGLSALGLLGRRRRRTARPQVEVTLG